MLIAAYHVALSTGSNPLINVSHLLVDIVLIAVFEVFAMRYWKSANTYLHFWQGMTIGLIVYGVSALIFLVSQAINFHFNPTALSSYKEASMAYLENGKEFYIEKLGEEGFTQQKQAIHDVSNWDLIISSSFKKIIAGFFITPVISIILRKKP